MKLKKTKGEVQFARMTLWAYLGKFGTIEFAKHGLAPLFDSPLATDKTKAQLTVVLNELDKLKKEMGTRK